MILNHFKQQAAVIKTLLAQKDIQIKHSLALEIIAQVNDFKNWDTLSGVTNEFTNKEDLTLFVDIKSSDPEIIKLLHRISLPYHIQCGEYRCADYEYIAPDEIDFYLSDEDNYKKQKEKQNTMEEHGISEIMYDFWKETRRTLHCLGNTKMGARCKNEMTSTRFMEDVSSFFQYFYHPKHFCKLHKNTIPELEKIKIAKAMRSNINWSFQRISEELQTNIYTVKKWLSISN